jgi:type II secretory pathway component PulF
MSNFFCHVVDVKGTHTTFVRDATHKAAVVRDLNQEGFFILSIEPSSAPTGQSEKRLKAPVILEFTQILAMLMANGLQLKDALAIAQSVGSSSVAPVFRIVGERVAKGGSLHNALASWRESFSPLFLGLVRIGERTGDLATIFQRLADYLAGRQAMRAKMINSLVYPLFVLGVAFMGILLLLTVILPKLSGMIGSLNPDAAAVYRRNIVAFNTGAIVALSALIFFAIGFVIALHWRTRDPDWARRCDIVFLRLPIAGRFVRCSFGLNFSFAMETLLTAGYSLEDALMESSYVIANAAFKAGILTARAAIIKGMTLSQALRDEKIFPQALTGWMAVGEGANDLVKSFAQVRAFYQKETDALYSRFMNLAEPALIMTVGGILIVLILTFVTPIFTMLGRLI